MSWYKTNKQPKKEVDLSPHAISRQMLYGSQAGQDQTNLKEPCPEPCPEKEVKQPPEPEIEEKEETQKKAKSKSKKKEGK